ncbi:hypothetical protein Pan153_17840 [Gimesia panareensis]|uniref:Cytochrome c domain-containing protein n=1 Tax=Gimesia panareensis TaxID=2527978 RepID=A0A518FLF8_9PLAN|nr:DUF1592 domain-containing protein [Gimesia panareensis]QDV17149.1 hypothetical protein Pan153_17840 [Gimesia panareensis]
MKSQFLYLIVFAAISLAPLLCQGAERTPDPQADAFSAVIQPVFQQNCVKCHGKNKKVEGEVNLLRLENADQLVSTPETLKDLIEAVDSGYMPPESEQPLSEKTRKQLVAGLKAYLKQSIESAGALPATPIRRMNRFQYNNAVQDLFELKVEVFSLPERMMREYDNYFRPQTGKMPPEVRVGSRPLGKSQLIEKRLGGVAAFPQDLRAENGFDNRGDHLSLSPLLLESFLRLSRSIVTSADFNSKTCGIWKEFFALPKDTTPQETQAIIEVRLRKFLTRAFRRPASDELVNRYTAYVMKQIQQQRSFTESMQDAAAAALASPQFFYLYDQSADTEILNSTGIDDFALASRLSFFLWGSIPDQTLLDLAAAGKLHEPDVLTEQVSRMLHDDRLKRFCDSFPVQWLQLERIISSTPDRQRYPQFYFSKYRASMHMMLEPLLLFETLLIEDQSVLKLIDSDFSYRSDLLDAWYRDGKQGRAGSPVTVNFRRVPVEDRRQGGVITNAAVMTMTSNATRTQPITRGAWIAGVILNDPPKPPPADVPLLEDKPKSGEENLTLRERFAAHRKHASCAGCHQRIDPLGFALENYDAAGLWRDKYPNGRTVDASGKLLSKHEFANIIEFKDALLAEKDRFTRAFAAHLLSFALGREIGVADSLALEKIVNKTAAEDYRFQSLIREIVLSPPFLQSAGTQGNEPVSEQSNATSK